MSRFFVNNSVLLFTAHVCLNVSDNSETGNKVLSHGEARHYIAQTRISTHINIILCISLVCRICLPSTANWAIFSWSQRCLNGLSFINISCLLVLVGFVHTMQDIRSLITEQLARESMQDKQRPGLSRTFSEKKRFSGKKMVVINGNMLYQF